MKKLIGKIIKNLYNLPGIDNLEGTIYYEPDNNKYEKSLIEYWKKIKGE